MEDTSEVLAVERRFFDLLLSGSADALDPLLVDDFIMVDLLSGSEICKSFLLSVLGTGVLKFDSIVLSEIRARRYDATVIVTGRAEMRMRLDETSLTTRSRYTHVFLQQRGQWRLVTAQGTQIADPPDFYRQL